MSGNGERVCVCVRKGERGGQCVLKRERVCVRERGRQTERKEKEMAVCEFTAISNKVHILIKFFLSHL